MMVSVVIPNYNHASFLKERIESVLNQTYQDFEVIILDDCSTDNSREIIEQYRTNPKVSHIVYNTTNSGSTFIQWNRGFNIAKGEYIWIAESDDIADPVFLETIMGPLLKNSSIVLGFSSLKFIDINSKFINKVPSTIIMRNSIESGDNFIKHNMLIGNNILNASSVVFKRDAAFRIPNDYLSYKSAGDYLFWVEILKNGKVYYSDMQLDFFRQHNKKVTPKSIASGIIFMETYRIYNRLKELHYINKYQKLVIVGYWLRNINKSRQKFIDKTTYVELIDLWKKEVNFLWLSSFISNLDRVLNFLKGLHKKWFLLKYQRDINPSKNQSIDLMMK